MELWVRHANKKKLLKVDCVGYEEYNNSLGEHYFYIYSDNARNLGEYATEERCIEIIDEIQKLLLSANPKEAFMLLKNIESDDYDELNKKMQRARADNFLPYCSLGDENASIEVIQPGVLVYEMPKE